MQRQRVLIVDDNPSLLLILTETFRLADFDVATATDGDGAIAAARRSRPDLLILDVGLPGRNGFEVCRTLRDDQATAELPIVLLTARAADGDRHWGLDAGADEYLTKPFDPERLVQTARELLASRHTGETRNPLTKLPDLEALGRALRARRRSGDQLVVRAVDFDPEAATVLRQKYGDPVCAHAIRLAAACLSEALAGAGGDERAIGHAGDASYSRFMVMAAPAVIEPLLKAAADRFAERVRAVYDPADCQRGGVMVHQADGDARCVPLLTLRVSAATDFEQEAADAA
jgi:DNA-binding response OmpR family regulator